MTHQQRPDGETRAAVLAILVREADMDGLVTIAEREVGDELGLIQSAVSRHIRNLAAEGKLTVFPDGAGYGRLNAIQLAEEVYA